MITSWRLGTGEVVRAWKCWELHRLHSKSRILLIIVTPVFNPRWHEAVLEVCCCTFPIQNSKPWRNTMRCRKTVHLALQFCKSKQVAQLLSYLYITPLCYGTRNDFGLPDWCQGGISIRGENIFFLVHTFQWQQNLIVFFTVLNWTWQSARSSPLGDGSMDSFLLFRWENWTVFLKASEAGVRS